MFALDLYRAAQCPCGCGHQAVDTLSHEEGGPRFVADRVTCRARLALIEAQRAVEDQKNPSPYAAARLWRVNKR